MPCNSAALSRWPAKTTTQVPSDALAGGDGSRPGRSSSPSPLRLGSSRAIQEPAPSRPRRSGSRRASSGAVIFRNQAFRREKSERLVDVLRQLRLVHVEFLQHHLLEVGALSARFEKLPQAGRGPVERVDAVRPDVDNYQSVADLPAYDIAVRPQCVFYLHESDYK